jgi:metal-sulfur cluster biosynthetic enzyme
MILEKKIINRLKTINDPELRQDVYSLKLVSNINVDEIGKNVSLIFRPTNFNCPIGIHLAVLIKKGLMEIKELKRVDVKVVDFYLEAKANEYLRSMDNIKNKEDT